MKTIEQLEADVQVEQEAVERAYVAGNRTASILYSANLKRALEALTQARTENGDM